MINGVEMKKYLSTIVAVLFAACFGALGQGGSGYVLDENILYSTEQNEYARQRCRLDVYYPVGVQDAPCVVWFHGGGLTGGNKFIPNELKKQNLIVVAVNYRLLPNCGLQDCIDDAAAAVAWTFRNVGKYGGNAEKIYVSGHSAGGYLTSMIGLDKKWLAKYDVNADDIAALVPFSGQVITHFAYRRQKGMSELQPCIDEFAPLYWVRRDAPPYIIITGDAELELYGRYEENLYMWRMLKLTGHPKVEIYKLDGYDHGSMAAPAFHILKKVIRR